MAMNRFLIVLFMLVALVGSNRSIISAAPKLSSTLSNEEPAPFFDLLPHMSPSFGPERPVKIDEPRTANLPGEINGASVQLNMVEQPFFSFIYSSSMDQNFDLELLNAAGQSMIQNIEGDRNFRVTLPRTGGFSRLWTISLRNFLNTNLTQFEAVTLSFLYPQPKPSSLEIHALGFSRMAPSAEPKVAFSKAVTTNRLLFYNGYLQTAASLDSPWVTIPGARSGMMVTNSRDGFFKVVPMKLPFPPVSSAPTNIASGTGGYMTVAVRSGFSIISNQLRTEKDTVGARLNTNFIFGADFGPTTLANGSAVIKLDEAYSFVPSGSSNIVSSLLEILPSIDASQISVNLYQDGAWTDPNQTLAPGDPVIFFNQGSEFTVAFVGLTLRGNLINHVPAGISLRSAMLPDVGPISRHHGFVPTPGDTITRLIYDSPQTYTFTEANTWDPSEPTLSTGEGVVINAVTSSIWFRFFTLFP
jgi:hypothetical protein